MVYRTLHKKLEKASDFDRLRTMGYVTITVTVHSKEKTAGKRTEIRRHQIGISVTPADLRPQRAVMGTLLRRGVPIAVQDGLIQVAFLTITIIVNRRGLNDAAAVGIVEKIISFLFLVPSSLLSTVSALGAQNIGAGKPERARATLRYACLLYTSDAADEL